MTDTIVRQRSRYRSSRSGRDSLASRSVRQKPVLAVANFDKPLLYVTMALALLGMVALFSASATEAMDKYGNMLHVVTRQALFFAMGFAMMFGVSKIPFFAWSRIAKPLAVVVILLLLYTLANGVETYGAERWIRIGSFQFQPSELGKLAVVALLAQALCKKSVQGFGGALVNLGLIGVITLLIFKQPNLSMTIILSGVSMAMMFVAGVPLFLLALGGGFGGAFVIYKLMHTEYQMRRIQGWLDPWKDPQDTGYNLIQSYYAISSGGLFGTGLGMSHQKLYYLPFQSTDFIFSVWAEEWGLTGCILLIGLFMVMLYRGYVIAQTCRSSFGQLLAMGITLILAIQIIINMFVATGLFPVTGVTLPLISSGGTSVMVTMIMIGILLNISRYRITSTPAPQRQTV